MGRKRNRKPGSGIDVVGESVTIRRDKFKGLVGRIAEQVVDGLSGLESTESKLDFARGFLSSQREQEFQGFKKARGMDGRESVEVLQRLMMELTNTQLMGRAGGEYAYWDRDGDYSTQLLREAGRTEIPAMIKNLRRMQLVKWGSPKRPTKPECLAIHSFAPHYTPDDKERTEMAKLAYKMSFNFFTIWTAGASRPSLGHVLGAAYEDWFDLDRVAYLVVRNMMGQPTSLTLIDPAMVKVIMPDARNDIWDEMGTVRLEGEEKKDWRFLDGVRGAKYKDEMRYLLMLFGRPIAAMTSRMLIYTRFFQTTDIMRGITGEPIMAKAMRVIESVTNTLTYNIDSFIKNRTPKGMLAVMGQQLGNLDMEVLQRVIWQQIMGIDSIQRLPSISLEKDASIQWLNFTQSSKDIEYYNWFSLLVTIICQLSGTDPGEIALASNKQVIGPESMMRPGPEGDVWKSQDSGLVTFLDSQANCINSAGIIHDMSSNKDWFMGFEGLEVEDEEKRTRILQTQKDWLSPNEIRARQDSPPIENALDRAKLEKWGISWELLTTMFNVPQKAADYIAQHAQIVAEEQADVAVQKVKNEGTVKAAESKVQAQEQIAGVASTTGPSEPGGGSSVGPPAGKSPQGTSPTKQQWGPPKRS